VSEHTNDSTDSVCLTRDIRETLLYHEAEAIYSALRRPGTGQISDAAEVHASPDGRHGVFSGTLCDELAGSPPTRICQVDLASGDTRVLTFGPNVDRSPRYSPDGRRIAFLSDRVERGNFQLFLLDPLTGQAQTTPRLEGWIEYLHWAPDGTRVLLGVAGHGADVSGAQGAVSSQKQSHAAPSWMPSVETGDESFRWRHAWVYELATNSVRRVSTAGINIWEAVWCGNTAIAAVVSPGPGEGRWYSACLQRVELTSGEALTLYTPRDQLGWPAASPDGKQVAVVEAVCSDRGLVAGDLLVIDVRSARVHRVNTDGVDVTFTEWRSEHSLLVAGHSGFETVVGIFDVATDRFDRTWSSRDLTAAGRYVSVSGTSEFGDCIFVAEGFCRAPEIGAVSRGSYRAVRSFDLGYAEFASHIHAVECLSWKASDGLEIQGWLLLPKGLAPYPLVLNVHGGPVWLFKPTYLGRSNVASLMLLKRGYAIFLPNPRGSSGRGQTFARKIFGDMGGAETTDHLSGIDHVVALGLADPKRLCVTGGSHGGFMASWIIGQDTRFVAAVPLAPITNWVSEHLVSNIPDFCAVALADRYDNIAGEYFKRSPVMHAHKVRTPTLNLCGALDRCTPPSEAVQFHNALLQNGVKSILVMYPEEGHGIRKFPAAIDHTARTVSWFEEHVNRWDRHG
jgi:dipeptidyl aminopeptidase/acylaminoacyl peptidase